MAKFTKDSQIFVRVPKEKHWVKGKILKCLENNEYEIEYYIWNPETSKYCTKTKIFENDISKPNIRARSNESFADNKNIDNINKNEKIQFYEIMLESKDCSIFLLELVTSLKYILKDGNTNIEEATIEFIAYCICQQLFVRKYEYRIGCISCPKVLQRSRIRMGFTRPSPELLQLLRLHSAFNYFFNMYSKNSSDAFCDGCTKTLYMDNIDYSCDDCNDGYCCLCIAKRINEFNKLNNLLNRNDILGNVLNHNCVHQITGFLVGLVFCFEQH
eukprot:413098_1